jgi:hypothetical protein
MSDKTKHNYDESKIKTLSRWSVSLICLNDAGNLQP